MRWLSWVAAALACALFTYGIARIALDSLPVDDLFKIESLVRKGRLDDAESQLRRLLDRSPRHGEARRLLARVLAQKGNVRACADELHKVPLWWPGKRDAQFLEGQAYHQLHLARPAERAWLGCLTDDALHPAAPGHVKHAAQSLVALYLVEQRLEDARDVLWQAYDQASTAERPAVLATRVRVESERIVPSEAVETLSRCVKADPADRVARVALVRALQAADRPADADRLLTALLRENPHDLGAQLARLHVLEARHDAEGLDRAVDALPVELANSGDPGIEKARAAVLEARGELEQAVASLRKAVAADPYDEEAHHRLARVLRRRGDAEGAELHRRRHRSLYAARRALGTALSRYAEAEKAPSTPGVRAAAIAELVELCKVLGWQRLADEWLKLIPKR